MNKDDGTYLRGTRPPPMLPFRSEKGRKRIIVASSPTFGNWTLMAKRLEAYTDGVRDPILLIGSFHQKGDKLAADWFGYYWYLYRIYHLNTEKHKDRAEFVRNIEMIKQADMLIAFHNGNPHPPLDHLIRVAKLRELEVHVVKYKPKAWIRVTKIKKPKFKIRIRRHGD